MHTHAHAHIHTHTHTYTRTRVDARIHAVCVDVCACLRSMQQVVRVPLTRTHIYTHAHILSHSHKSIYTCTHTHLCVPTHMHTHTHTHLYTLTHTYTHLCTHTHTAGAAGTGWRRCIGCFQLQVIFCKRAMNCWFLLRKMIYENKASHGSLPTCTNDTRFLSHTHTN